MIKRIFLRGILDRRFCALTTAILLLMSLGLARLENDNSIHRWLQESEVKRNDFKRFHTLFGADDFIYIMIDKAAPNDPFLITALNAFEVAARESLPVETIIDPLDYLNEGIQMEEGGQAAAKLVISFFWNPDGPSVGIMLLPKGEGFARKHIAVLRDLAARHLKSWKTYMAGPPVFNDAIAGLGERNQRIFYPFVGAFLAIGIWIVFRSIPLGLLCLSSVLLSALASFGLAGWLGLKIDLVSGSLPPMLMVIGMTSSIHLLKAWQRLGGSRYPINLTRAVMDTWTPSLMACVTTAIGFGSFATSDIPALSGMGILSPLGILISWLSAYTLPTLAVKIPWFSCPSANHAPTVHPAPLEADERRAKISRARSIGECLCVAGTVLVMGLTTLYMTHLEFESNPLLFFEAEDDLPQSYSAIEKSLVGLSPIEAVFKSNPTINRKMYDLSVELDKIPNINHTLFLGCPMIDLAGFPVMVSPTTLFSDPLTPKYISADGQFVRLSIFANTLGSKQYRELIQQVENALYKICDREDVVSISGVVPTIIRAQNYLLQSQMQGLASAALVIFIITAIGLRSITHALLAMVPNVLPVLLLLSALIWLGIALDVATIMVANVTLGIAVDDTYHFFFLFGRRRKSGIEVHAAVAGVKQLLGPAMFGATFVNSLGFAVLIFSSFPPMQNFGIFVASGLWLAVFCDWLLLPSLLAVANPKIKV